MHMSDLPSSVSVDVSLSNSTCSVLCIMAMSCKETTSLGSCVVYCGLLMEYTIPEKLKRLTTIYVYSDIKSCGRPKIEGARADQVKGHIGDKVKYKCQFDHEFCLIHPTPIISCLPSGQWTDPPASCHRTIWDHLEKEETVSARFGCPAKRNAMIEVNGKVTTQKYGNISCLLETKSNNITYNFKIDLVHKNSTAFLTSRDKANIRWNSIRSPPKVFQVGDDDRLNLKLQLTGRYIKCYVNTLRLHNFYMTDNYSIFGIKLSGDISVQNIQLYPFSFLF